jgi:hypothetical protein
MTDDKRDWVAEHEHEHPETETGSETRPENPAKNELADELRSIRAVGEDRS